MVTVSALFSFFQQGLAPLSLLPSSLRLEAKELACLAAGIAPSDFWDRQDMALPDKAQIHAETLLARRLEGEPLAYLLGAWDFYGRTFFLNESCLIPRADSETLIDAALALLPAKADKPLRLLDLCCGSGCLGLTLALERAEGALLTLADLSPGALDGARKNAQALAICPPPVFLTVDALQEPPPIGPFDIVLFNPPYLTSQELAGPYGDSLAFEPAAALDGGPDGLAFYRAFALSWQRVLAPGGLLLAEVGLGQAGPMSALLSDGFEEFAVHKDLGGVDRVVSARKKTGKEQTP